MPDTIRSILCAPCKFGRHENCPHVWMLQRYREPAPLTTICSCPQGCGDE